MTPEERIEARFERIEANLEQMAERQKDLQAAHIELEAAQLNQLKAHTRLEEVVTDVSERIANLTILVDRLIARDLNS